MSLKRSLLQDYKKGKVSEDKALGMLEMRTDNSNLWKYIEDGELPELKQGSEIFDVSRELLVKAVDGEYDLALLFWDGENYHWEFDDRHDLKDGKSDYGKLEDVICWMEIPETKK